MPRSLQFTHDALTRIRIYVSSGYRMTRICNLMATWYTRAQIVEAIDALHRHENTWDALRHVNTVLALQNAGVPLINGKPYTDAERRAYEPMF